ncbi:MAG: mechanosensitive ion channel [Proteobacteria bacterium]|nr:mechanosensitive ion channel [Pseudomonadota bacterium]
MPKYILLLLVFLSFAAPVQSQTPEDNFAEINFNQTDKQLNAMTARLNSGKADKEQTADYVQQLSQIQESLNKSRQRYAAAQDSAQKKLNALGEAPEKGTEPAAISRQRKEFTAEVDANKAQIAQLDLLSAKIDEINALILKLRNRRLLNNILVKQSSILHPQEFLQSLGTFAGFLYELAKSPLSWYNGLSAERQTTVNNNILGVAAAMLAALIAAYLLSRRIKKLFGYQEAVERPDYSQKVKAAVWMFIARGAIPAAIIGAFLFWQKNNSLINTGSFGLLLNTAALYLLYYYLSKAVVKVTFTPFNGKWRIIEVKDNRAKSISSSLIFSAAAICIVSFFQTLAGQMDYDSSIIYSLKIFGNAVKAFCVILVARKALYDNKTLSDEEITEDTPVAQLSTNSKISFFIAFAMSIAFILSLFGYIRLSEYIINRSIVSAVVIGVFYIVDNLIRGLFHRILLLRFWIRTFRINRRTLVKTEFWFGLLLTPVIWIFGILTLLAVWGVSVDLLLARVKSFLVGFNIGGIRISITSILLGLISFFILLSLFKMLKNSFISGKLSKIEMNDGVRNSVVSSIGFLGFIISGILAIAVMGGSLSSITIIAGALSFGVGLGLQNMVSNLAAGMTILWERPIKIGDWVIINGQEGIVRQINMRSTELETWDKSTVIIPNSDILSKSLINYTYYGRTGRVVIKVGVDYKSDIEKVKQTLLEIAASNADVLTTPAPSVSFNNLGDSSLEFQLNCFTADVFKRSAISNDLRQKIVSRFRDLAINIPYPQQTVYMELDSVKSPPKPS